MLAIGLLEPFFTSVAAAATSLAALPPLPAPSAPILTGVFILVLCVIAGIGTYLLLPRGRDGALRWIGGVIVLAGSLILVASLVRYAAGHGGGMGLYFWIFSAIALFGALRVITHPRPVYSALYFVLATFASAGLFVLLWAEFMAAALVLIYAGAILVTYVFVIMLAASAGATQTPAGKSPLAALAEYDAVSREPLVAAAVGFGMMGILLFVIFDRGSLPARQGPATPRFLYVAADPQGQRRMDKMDAVSAEAVRNQLTASGWKVVSVDPMNSTQGLGIYLFQEQALNLELAGLMLTLGMIGAIVIARRRMPSDEVTSAGPMVEVTAPMTPINDDPHSIPVYGTTNPRQKAYPET